MSPTAATAFLGLGANVGDPIETLHAAVHAIDDVDGVAVEDVSGVYRTPPWPPSDDPRSIPQDDYHNAVVRVRTTRTPQQLLDEVLLIETAFGRDRATEVRWGPRVLDIDVLLFGGVVLESGDLTLPHPRLAERAFVLVPLLEVFAGGTLPDGRRLTSLLMAVDGADEVELAVRLDDVPGFRIPRPAGPAGPAPSLRRPEGDDLARDHGADG